MCNFVLLKDVKLVKETTMKTLLAFIFMGLGLTLNAQQELKTYHDNGSLKSVYVYTDAQNYTVKNYFQNGKLKEVGAFANGKMTGTWINYHESGQKAGEANYDNGVKVGEWKVYDQDGLVRYKVNYKDNKMISAVSLDQQGQHIAETISR